MILSKAMYALIPKKKKETFSFPNMRFQVSRRVGKWTQMLHKVDI